MPKLTRATLASAIVITLAGLAAAPALAQSKGKIVCWKDKAGNVVGCGDTIPPEYRDNAGEVLDRRGIQRGTVESAEQEARRKAREQEMARQKEEERRRLAEQKRLDSALLNTYANVKEIDQRRDRDLQQVELAITQLQAPLKNATTRHEDAVKRKAEKEIAQAAAEKEKYETSIAAKEKEKAEIIEKYAEQRKRYQELRGGGQSAAAAPAAPPGKAAK